MASCTRHLFWNSRAGARPSFVLRNARDSSQYGESLMTAAWELSHRRSFVPARNRVAATMKKRSRESSKKSTSPLSMSGNLPFHAVRAYVAFQRPGSTISYPYRFETNLAA
jgi:hypothetical protein